MYFIKRDIILCFLVCAVNCDIFFNELTIDIDQCKDVCADSFFLLPKGNDIQNICQRGCRFFNIIYLKDDHDLNITQEECYLSCEEAYVDTDPKTACNVGCKAMSKKKECEMASMLFFIEQDNPKNIMLVEPELELPDSDLVSDPLIKNQIEIGYNVQYKIPETKIRTMPIDEVLEVTATKQVHGDWLDCAARNSGIPKWILFVAIVSAILIAVWLSISSERKVIIDDEVDLVKDDEVSIIDENEAEELPPKDPKLLESVQFSSPQKYSVETEQV